ncbi:Vitamin K epoxide reductase family protein [Pseudobythopirellula maris]|uniref:Vitamin K epoxide reductase family protein n=1 Tax=Pseudobythopirellula maris TaxID=2527991 RepID=A0A5C5ZSN6_9BACT|nr:vitamin K epoxide reductase family protein [Pseudobythopirellula maris]TWT89997.1 Vitamin K epoxide reductase family protein [Pseudobythopirellula maris]
MHESPNPSPLLVWPLRLLSLVAAGLSVFLFLSTGDGPVAGCDFSAFDCHSALASRWSSWLGLSVALGGALCYAAVFVASWLAPADNASLSSLGWRVLEAATPVAVGAALWFIGLQAFVLEGYCLYCLMAHAAGVTALLLAFFLRRSLASEESSAQGPMVAPVVSPLSGSPMPLVATEPAGPPRLGWPSLLGVVALTALVGGQILLPPKMSRTEIAELDESIDLTEAPAAETRTANKAVAPAEQQMDETPPADETAESPAPAPVAETPRVEEKTHGRRKNGSRVAEFLGGKLRIDTYKYPILGSPEAPHVVVEMMDYSCSHCRAVYPKLIEAQRRFGGDVAILILPVPTEILCNPYVKQANRKSRGSCKLAKLAVAFARLEPEHFEKLHSFMLRDEEKPSYTEALIEAQTMADRDRLSAETRLQEIPLIVQRNIELWVALRRRQDVGLPLQIYGDAITSGDGASVEEICELWSKQFGVEPTRGGRRKGSPLGDQLLDAQPLDAQPFDTQTNGSDLPF